MTKVIVDKEQLEKLLEVIGNDCPAEIFNEEISWCNEEYCINCDEKDCIKKWLGVKELPKKLSTEVLFEKGSIYYIEKTSYINGFNECLDEVLEESEK